MLIYILYTKQFIISSYKGIGHQPPAIDQASVQECSKWFHLIHCSTKFGILDMHHQLSCINTEKHLMAQLHHPFNPTNRTGCAHNEHVVHAWSHTQITYCLTLQLCSKLDKYHGCSIVMLDNGKEYIIVHRMCSQLAEKSWVLVMPENCKKSFTNCLRPA